MRRAISKKETLIGVLFLQSSQLQLRASKWALSNQHICLAGNTYFTNVNLEDILLPPLNRVIGHTTKLRHKDLYQV